MSASQLVGQLILAISRFLIRDNPGGNHHSTLNKDPRIFEGTMTSVEMATNNSIKRRKTEQGVAACLVDLPIGIFEHTAGFLAPISRALFAVALTNDENNNSPGENYSSIAGSDWDTLDFGEIEKVLAVRLSDDDIRDILQHIDAVNNVKRLKLTNCTNITGVGLEPLRGSTMIEQIDLSLVGDGENPRLLDPNPPISLQAVLPILDSIIRAEGCVLKYLQFPFTWRRNRSTDSEFHAFILRYHQMWVTRDTVTCLYCDEDLLESGQHWILPHDGRWYGTQNHVFYQCTNHYCSDCSEEDGNRNFAYCDQCQRDYCKNCVKVDDCERCGELTCEHCSNFTECDKCNGKFCAGCAECYPPTVCVYCGVSYCDDCNDGVDGVRFCDQCPKSCCNSCRLRMCQERISDCDDCIKLLPQNTLVAQLRRLQEEVGHLKNENRELKLENKQLRGP